jgi:hypothetical protein
MKDNINNNQRVIIPHEFEIEDVKYAMYTHIPTQNKACYIYGKYYSQLGEILPEFLFINSKDWIKD